MNEWAKESRPELSSACFFYVLITKALESRQKKEPPVLDGSLSDLVFFLFFFIDVMPVKIREFSIDEINQQKRRFSRAEHVGANADVIVLG